MKQTRFKKLNRFNISGHYHELTFSCLKKMPLLKSDRACKWLFDSIYAACDKHDYQLIAFVFMPNHVHLIVCPNKQEYRIEDFLKSLKLSVSKKAKNWLAANDPEWMKKLVVRNSNGKKGFRFWRHGGGYDRNITNESTLKKMIDYIHRNPVRKGWVDNPIEWKWSSARSYYEQ